MRRAQVLWGLAAHAAARARPYAKAIIAAVGAVLTATAGTLPNETQHYAQTALAILTVLGVYQVPNATRP